jgi:DNA invertase Pin-like site-specific DNA recombinase
MTTVIDKRRRSRRATSRELAAAGVPTRVAFYVRVSSEEQTERATARNQIDFLQKKYQANFDADSLEPMQFVGQFTDDGYSGALAIEDRPDGKRLLDLVRARGVDVVISYRLDRLGRRLGVLLDIHEEFERYNVAILSATEPFDTRTPIGQFVFQLLGSIAELERETIIERFTLGRDRSARDGKFINGPVPIGYDLQDNRLVPSEREIPQLGCTEADMVRQIFKRAAAGESAAALTVWLRANGVPSTTRFIRRDGAERERVAQQWNSARMQDLIHSPTYYGERELNYSGAILRQEVAPLVSRALWERANANVSGRISKFNAGQNDGYVYLLSGKLFCSECGRRMLGNYKVDRDRLYYVCSSARSPRGRRGPDTCQARRNASCDWNVCSNIRGVVGVVRGWAVIPLPAQGTLSNVSAFVLPGRMPVADDERQLSMFPSDDPVRELLFNVIKTQAEGIRMISAVAAGFQSQLKAAVAEGFEIKPLADGQVENKKPRRHVPRNPDHRVWQGFVRSMQRLEQLARAADLKPTKHAVCQLGPDDAKTVTRTMTLTYGLHAEDWPPSTWPTEPPLTS